MTLQERIAAVEPLNREAMDKAWARWDAIAKPLRSLGLLEESVVQMAGILGTDQVEIRKPCGIVVCADNGVVEEGVTQTDHSVTALVEENLSKGISSMCVFCKAAGADVFGLDLGVYRDVDAPGVRIHKLGYGTGNIAKGPAMSRSQAEEGILEGVRMVQDLAQKGYDFFLTGEMGIGNTTTSSAMASVLLGLPVEEVTGRGAGLSSEGLRKKIAAIKRAVEINQPNPEDPLDVLSKVGGFDLAGMIGLFLGGALVRRPVVIDGFISSIAALCAVRLCPQASGYILPSHLSEEPAGKLVLKELGKKPLPSRRARCRATRKSKAESCSPIFCMVAI